MRTVSKFLIAIAIGLIVLYLAITLRPGSILLTRLVQRQLAEFIESPVQIDRIQTNLFNRIQVTNFSVGSTDSTQPSILSFNKLRVHFDLLGLFKKKILLDRIEIDQLQIHISKDTTGRYNLPRMLFASDTTAAAAPDETSEGFAVMIGHLRINDLRIGYLEHQDSLRVELRQMQVGMDSEPSDQNTKIGWLTARAGELGWAHISQPIQQCDIAFRFDPIQLEISKFILETEHIQFAGVMRYDFVEQNIPTGRIDAAIQLELLNPLFAESSDSPYRGRLELAANFAGPIERPSASIRLTMNQGSLASWEIDQLQAELSLHDQTLELIQFSASILTGEVAARGRLDFGGDSLQYRATFALRQLPLDALMRKFYAGTAGPMQGFVNGQLSLAGTGTDWLRMNAQADVKLINLAINSKQFPPIHANLLVAQGDVTFQLDQNGSKAQVIGRVAPDQSLLGRFNAHLLDISPFASIAGLTGVSGQLNLDGHLSGSVQTPIIGARLQVRDGNFQGFPLKELEAMVRYEAEQLVISNLIAKGSSNELLPLAQTLGVDSLAGKLWYEVIAQGTLENLISQIRFNWDEPQINGLKFHRAKLFASTTGNKLSIDSLRIEWNNYWLAATGELPWQPDLSAELAFAIIKNDSLTGMPEKCGAAHLHGKLSDRSLRATLMGEAIALAPFAEFLGIVDSISGQLSFDASWQGQLDQPEVKFRGRVLAPSCRGYSLDSLTADLDYRNQMLTIAHFLAAKHDGMLTLEGRWPLRSEKIERFDPARPKLLLHAHNFDLQFVSAFLPDSMQFAGKISGEVDLKSIQPHPSLVGQLQIQDALMKLPRIALASMEMQTRFNGSTMKLDRFAGKMNQFPFRFQGEARLEPTTEFEAQVQGEVTQLARLALKIQRHEDHTLIGSLNIPDLNLGHLFQLLAIDLQPTGTIAINAELSGTDDVPVIDVSLQSQRIAYETAQLDSLQLNAKYQNHQISLTQSGARIGNGTIQMEGLVPLAVLLEDSSKTPDQMLQFQLIAQELEIDWLRLFFPDLELLRGRVNSQIRISGTLEQPSAYGFVTLNDGLVKIKGITPEITAIASRIDFNENQVSVTDLSGRIGAGNFASQGQALLSSTGLSESNFRMNLDKIKLTLPKIAIIGIERGEMNLVQTGAGFAMKGNIRLSETKYIQDFRPRISQFLTRLPSRSEPGETLNDVQFDVILQGIENIWIDNNLAKLQLSATLNLQGTLAQPNISGRVIVHKGYVLYLDRKFKLTSGSVYFSDPHRINPLIDITAVSEVTEYQGSREVKYTITLKLSGPLEKLEFSLASDPALDRANIVSLLTLGRTRESLMPQSANGQRTSLQQVMLTRFQELGAHRLADFTEQKLSEAFDLENISIEGNLLQWDRTWAPRITASKRLSSRFNVTYSTVVGHSTEQQIKLGYQLTKYLSIIGNTGQIGQSGIDLKFHYKFY